MTLDIAYKVVRRRYANKGDFVMVRVIEKHWANTVKKIASPVIIINHEFLGAR